MNGIKITALDYIDQVLSQTPQAHIMDLVEGYSMACQAGMVNKTRWGYATAVNNAVYNMRDAGKIKIVDFWTVVLITE